MSISMPTGVKGCRYAIQTSDPQGGIPTYGQIYTIPGLNQVNYQPNSATSRAFGDNGVQASAETVGDQSLTVNILQIPNADKARLFGFPKTNGVLASSGDNVSPYVAFGYEITKDNGESYFVWFPKVKFQKPGSDNQTQANSVNFQMDMCEAAINNLTANNIYRTLVETDDPDASATTIANWFNAPVTSETPDLGAVTATITKVSTNVLYTFAKVGGGNITLTAAQLSTASMPVFKGASGVAQAGAYVIALNGTAAPTVTFTPTVAFGTASVSAAVTSNSVFDTNGVATSAAGAVLSYP